MNCPLCRTPMKTVRIGNVDIDECDDCHGLFFDNYELQRFDEESEGEGPDLERILGYDAETAKRSEKVTCPKCDCKMREHRFSAACSVRVDECASCGGIWLDKGELGVIRANFATDEERAKLVDRLANELGLAKAVGDQMRDRMEATEAKHTRGPYGRKMGGFGSLLGRIWKG